MGRGPEIPLTAAGTLASSTGPVAWREDSGLQVWAGGVVLRPLPSLKGLVQQAGEGPS